MKEKMFPPFCVHFYPEKWTDFPICSDWFLTFEDALKYAASHYPGYIYRIGYWSAPKSDLKNRYFYMTEVGVDYQFSLWS